MNKIEERELFLKYIVDVYFKNLNISVSSDIIYHELSRFNVNNGENSVIDNDSLIGVQLGLNNKFKNNSKVNTFTSRDGYFWAIENRCGKEDKEFLSDMYNSIKIYISVDLENIYKISELLFNFMIKEKIVMQCKISKSMRNDALVCRVSGREAATKVCEYLESLNYESKIKPNPFLMENGKTYMAMDGRLSYNYTLATLLKQYFNTKKSKKQLDGVSCEQFNKFVKEQIRMLGSGQRKYYIDLYGLNTEEKYKDFMMICNLISKNLDNSLSLEQLYEYGDIRSLTGKVEKNKYSKQDEDKILYVINGLTNYYSITDVHRIIMKYIETGDVKYFTRKDDIRTIVSDNFDANDVKKIISNLGYNAFVSASRITYDKYGEEQLFAAIKDLFNGDGLKKFTNDYGARSRLGLVIPYQLLKEVIVSKLTENGLNVSSISLANFVLDEIGKSEEIKNNMERLL